MVSWYLLCELAVTLAELGKNPVTFPRNTVVFLQQHRKPKACATAVSGLLLHFLFSLLALSVSTRVSSMDLQLVCAHTNQIPM